MGIFLSQFFVSASCQFPDNDSGDDVDNIVSAYGCDLGDLCAVRSLCRVYFSSSVHIALSVLNTGCPFLPTRTGREPEDHNGVWSWQVCRLHPLPTPFISTPSTFPYLPHSQIILLEIQKFSLTSLKPVSNPEKNQRSLNVGKVRRSLKAI